MKFTNITYAEKPAEQIRTFATRFTGKLHTRIIIILYLRNYRQSICCHLVLLCTCTSCLQHGSRCCFAFSLHYNDNV